MESDTKICPYCAETIKAEAIICRYCGRDLRVPPPASKVASSTKPRPAKKRLPVWATATLGTFLVCCGFSFLIYIFGDNDTGSIATQSSNIANDTSSNIEVANPQLPPTEIPPAVAPPEPAPPYQEIYNNALNMTEAQWNQYADSLKGKAVIDWIGWVVDVNEKFFGGYELLIDMDSPDEIFSTYDVQFDISEDVALGLNIDQKLIFSGSIFHVTRILGSSIVITLNEGATFQVIEQ
jgi:hypothetical protein